MSDKTEITPEALLRRVLLHRVPDGEHLTVIAAAALLIREGLDNLAKDNRPLTPDEAFGPQTDDMAPPEG